MNAEVSEVQSPAEAGVETVSFDNGNSVEFVGKRKMIKRTSIEGDQVSVDLYFRNGQHRRFDLPDAMIARFAGHGAEQKLGDATAGLSNINDMVESVDSLIAQLQAGDWSARREASGFAGQSVLLRALVQVSGKPVERVREYLKGLKQNEKLALRQSPRLKPTIEAIEAEDAKEGTSVDTESLLEAL